MKKEAYETLLGEVEQLFNAKTPFITLLDNLSAELKARFSYYSWVGFYLIDGNKLILGPFQGLPACDEIALGRGVCGTSAQERTTIVVPDVHSFPGHIACDAGSKSEIVVPLVKDGYLWGVLDVDSYALASFNEVDKLYLERLATFMNGIISLNGINVTRGIPEPSN